MLSVDYHCQEKSEHPTSFLKNVVKWILLVGVGVGAGVKTCYILKTFHGRSNGAIKQTNEHPNIFFIFDRITPKTFFVDG